MMFYLEIGALTEIQISYVYQETLNAIKFIHA